CYSVIIFLFFLATFSLIFLLLTKHQKNEPFHPPPGPKGLPLIGNLHQFNFLKPHLSFAKLAKIYGPIYTLRFVSKNVVVIQSSTMAKEVLQTQDLNFCHRPISVGMQRLTYNGSDIMFAKDFEYFREIRKICALHLFSAKRVQCFAPILQDEFSRLVHKISSLASASKLVNLSELLFLSAGSNICKLAFVLRKIGYIFQISKDIFDSIF
ncbi:cytochrome P450 83B1-like, partial [Chenopodium quinoa]|uniref:cytochrome P450 83B1-like n=1 Tax=Chenopodium quinoa TaxID=63459 RepID=UPI000B77D11A